MAPGVKGLREVLCDVNGRSANSPRSWLHQIKTPAPPPFPVFQSDVMSRALKNPRFIMKPVIRWALFCFESADTVSHSPELAAFRGRLWGWVLGTLTDLSGSLPSENSARLLVNLLPCSEGEPGFHPREPRLGAAGVTQAPPRRRCYTYSGAKACSSATPWTVAHQVPLSMGVSRQGAWSG